MNGLDEAEWRRFSRESRVHDRFETDQIIELCELGDDAVGRMLNLSRSGAMIYSYINAGLQVGEPMSVTLLDGTNLNGRIEWRYGNGFGLRFNLFLEDAIDHLHFDHLGADYWRRLLSMQTKATTIMTGRPPVVPVRPANQHNPRNAASPVRPRPVRPQPARDPAQPRYFIDVTRAGRFGG